MTTVIPNRTTDQILLRPIGGQPQPRTRQSSPPRRLAHLRPRQPRRRLVKLWPPRRRPRRLQSQAQPGLRRPPQVQAHRLRQSKLAAEMRRRRPLLLRTEEAATVEMVETAVVRTACSLTKSSRQQGWRAQSRR